MSKRTNEEMNVSGVVLESVQDKGSKIDIPGAKKTRTDNPAAASSNLPDPLRKSPPYFEQEELQDIRGDSSCEFPQGRGISSTGLKLGRVEEDDPDHPADYDDSDDDDDSGSAENRTQADPYDDEDVMEHISSLSTDDKVAYMIEAFSTFGEDLVMADEHAVDNIIQAAAQIYPDWFEEMLQMIPPSGADHAPTPRVVPATLPPGPTTGPGVSAADPVDLLDSDEDEKLSACQPPAQSSAQSSAQNSAQNSAQSNEILEVSIPNNGVSL
jgi:hypothetical protein